MTLVFFAYIGFDNITNVAEEVKDPQKVIPRGLLWSVAISTSLYVLVGLAVVGLAGVSALSESDAPLAHAASVVLGDRAFEVLAVIAMLTTFNTVLVLCIASSRIIYGMATEGVLPRLAGTVAKGSGAPWIAVIAVVAGASAFLSIGDIGEVAGITSFGSLITFALVNLALLHLRRVAPRHERPFRSPFSIGWLSITGLLGVVSCLALMTQFNWLSATVGLVLPGSGAVFYWFYGRHQPVVGTEPLHEPHEPGAWEWPDFTDRT
jgi:APA family basic amino acid/polyamine antiporter